MKLATLKNGTRDGRLVVVSRDLQHAVDAFAMAPTLQHALDHWRDVQPALQQCYDRLNEGTLPAMFSFNPARAMAPLPRAYQFIDASAFLNHGDIMERAFNVVVDKQPGIPIVLQRQADDFRGPHDDYIFPSAEDNADFEGELAVVLDDVPMGTVADAAEQHIKLFCLFNDVSMRKHLARELKLGFGFIQAKPASVFAPVAVTPDELGSAWRDGKVHLDLQVHRNGRLFGHPNGGQMDFTFGQLIAHLAYNRNLRAGTVLGTGTFSNKEHAQVGSACLAERRALDVIEFGEPRTPWVQSGEQLRFEMFAPADQSARQSLFGAIDFKMVVSASS